MTVHLLKMAGGRKEITLRVNPRNISELVGHKKSNIDFVKSNFFIDKFEIFQDKSVEPDTLVLFLGEKYIIMSKKDYYSISSK